MLLATPCQTTPTSTTRPSLVHRHLHTPPSHRFLANDRNLTTTTTMGGEGSGADDSIPWGGCPPPPPCSS
ncbi:hypothetical protein GUJ93_ZPchr0012g22155 [Zizania palustris]|uniref:Uncharacterized protein n=1 Tax=Zizania palustris TaxID=103762 RepID=A0A8J5WM05_ZIZPA|nr:hypothetical protein GUJ93_ZPchr0012g22155 [Zizania palustris]